MVVDDTPANLRLLSNLLTERGYHVRPVPSGALALSAVQAEPPDLILLDIRMPAMSGYEVCQQLKADLKTSDIPIIFISALDALDDKVKAFATGGVDYVTKPFQSDEVLARVATHLALRRLQKELQEANRRMAQELILAGEVQASFLPRVLPTFPGWQLSVTMRPARETSGDFYDVNLLPNGRVGLLVADVVDKGVGAALLMALSWSLYRIYTAEYPAQPDLVFAAVNRYLLSDTRSDQFITAFYGMLDPVTGSLTYCNAGHNPPVLLSSRQHDTVRSLGRTGMVLGVAEDEAWQQASVNLEAGDVLVIYSDGITDAEDGQGRFFGKERLLAVIEKNLERSAVEIRDAVVAAVDDFVGEQDQFDDMILMVVVREG
jgi:sigma-B regulation protein RsbU (phosphoserine phosphatase)